MFNKKPRRNFRQRKETSSDEEEGTKNSGDGEDNEKAKVSVNKPSTLSQGRGISCSSKREPTPPKSDSSDGEEAETLDVTGEIKDDVKNKHGQEKKKKDNVLSFSDDKEAEEPTFKVKKSTDKAVLFQVRKKEASPAKSRHSTAPAGRRVPPSASSRLDSDEENSVASPFSLPPDDDDEDEDAGYNNSDGAGAMSPAASSASNSSHSASKPVMFPSSKEIKAAKRQRRAKRHQKEFIPLGRDGHSSAGSTPDHYSREDEDDKVDDDDDEPDDHEKRIEFAPRLKSIRERIAEKLGGSDGSLSGSDGEEQELWEETQIGKGVKRHPGGQSPSGSESSSYSSSSRGGRHDAKKRPARVPKTLPPVSVSMIKKRISGKLESLKEVYRARQAELRKMEGDVDWAKTSVETLEESPSESQLKFYRTMNLYVHNLVECLREKVVEINSLELELHTLLSDQMEAVTAQRQQSIKEQAERLQQLSYNKDDQTEASGTQTQSAKDSDTKNGEHFNIPEDTQPSEEDQQLLQKKKADIMLRSQAVFSDVQDEFCDVKKILSRFEEWRGCYSESYHNAYISLCLPKLLNPIIRNQLLMWNPLKDDSGDFEKLPWFTAVETFCHGHGHEELDHIDRQTLSTVIEKTILPKITAFVELVWDPMSHQQSVCLSDVCCRLKEDYSIFEEEPTKPVKAFREAVMRRLRSCVDEDVFIPLYPKNLLEDSSSPQRHFRDQQFGMAIKLLGNMGKFDLLLPESVLRELMLDRLLNRYLMLTLSSQTLHNGAVHACRMIADSLPVSWLEGQDVCLPQLQNFKNHLVQKVHTLCKQQLPEDPNTRSAVLEVLLVLSKIRCNDSILALADKYHYEDLIYSHQLLNQDAS
ncbi:intron Large complex component GCFC2 [Halichoeres trimaculatus]|uniref:intron Large complex component GCFC2 n=1 Tax=Halichoeres trimaculatus TaxID=147232 RepID=UPI003D9F4E7B